jgi:release factor glutamine methyltransferase
VTVLEAIRKGTEFLERKGIDSPRLQVELLLAHLLGVKRMDLYLNFERQLQPQQIDALRDMILRRAKHEPLQYILGSVNFCGLEIKVTPAVLIPRPETEILAELCVKYLKEISKKTLDLTEAASKVKSSDRSSYLKVIDYGTGSGCIAVYLAVNCHKAQILAVDASERALEVARENAARHGVQDRIEFIKADSILTLCEVPKADLLVSNPPYIPTEQIPKLQPEIRDYEPRIAIDGGADGLQVLKHLAEHGGRVLKDHGMIMVEFGDDQEQKLKELFSACGWSDIQIVNDDGGQPRFLAAVWSRLQ